MIRLCTTWEFNIHVLRNNQGNSAYCYYDFNVGSITPIVIFALNKFNLPKNAKMEFDIHRCLLLLTLSSVVPATAQHVRNSSYHIKLGLMFSVPPWPVHYRHFKPACDIAIENVNKLAQEGQYLNITLSYVWSQTDNRCGNPFMKAPGIASRLYHEHNIVALFGPPCSQEMFGVADVAAYYNIPVLSGASTSGTLDQKDRYRTLTRTSYKLSTFVNFLLSLFAKFKWDAAAILWDMAPYWPLVSQTVKDLLEASNIPVQFVLISHYSEVTDALAETIRRGRSKF